MYSDKGGGLMLPYFHSFEEFCLSQSSIGTLGSLVQTSTISDYDLGGEGDLFKAPEPVIEESTMSIDPMKTAISMISCGEDISEAANIESMHNEQLLSEVFYECKKDLLAKDAIETPLSEIMDLKLPSIGEIDGSIPEDELYSEGLFGKSVSSGCISSMRPTFLDFPGDDLETLNGIRRSFSEGDIKTRACNNVNVVHSPHGLPPYLGNCSHEDRMQKLSRYRDKKSRRNFGRKIKYACRKALADNQPRVRGRFSKIEDSK